MYYLARPMRWTAATLLALYGVVIVRLTLAPADTESGTFGALDRLMTALSHGRLQWTQAEVLANVALFVPAGFLLWFVLRRGWAAVLVCVLASAAIELAQERWLPSRVPSLADVEHNGVGGVLGAALAWTITVAFRAYHRPDESTARLPPAQALPLSAHRQ